MLAVFVPVAAHAITSITQEFSVEEKLPLGSIVSLVEESQDRVEPATIQNAGDIYGVVVNDQDALLSFNIDNERQVNVANSGIVPVLVSDLNGEIKRGDHITASPITGVGMKATSNVKVIGVAQRDFTQEQSSEHTYTDSNGQEETVMLGEVPVYVNVSYYFKEPDKSLIPSALQNLANSVAGKEVKPLPIIVSAVIFVVTLIAVASIMFSMVRSSIISVGRNPMSQSAIYRNLMQISALVIGILSVATVSIYLILTRF